MRDRGWSCWLTLAAVAAWLLFLWLAGCADFHLLTIEVHLPDRQSQAADPADETDLAKIAADQIIDKALTDKP